VPACSLAAVATLVPAPGALLAQTRESPSCPARRARPVDRGRRMNPRRTGRDGPVRGGCPSGARLTVLRALSYSKRSSRSLAQRGSGALSCAWPGSSLRFAPHSGHRPAQSARHRTWLGSVSAYASRAHWATSRTPSCTAQSVQYDEPVAPIEARASIDARLLAWMRAGGLGCSPASCSRHAGASSRGVAPAATRRPACRAKQRMPSWKAAPRLDVLRAVGPVADHGGLSLPATDAQRGDAAMQVLAFHLVQQRDQDAPAAGTDRVAERDRAAVRIHAVRG
jgi:hypothetical protein